MAVQNEARASYVAVGRRQVVEQTIWQIPWWRTVDPLAQTFSLLEDRFITSVGLFFGSKDPNQNVTVQIRNVVNGYPGPVVLATKTLTPDEVKVSTNGTQETKVTFPDPVFIPANVEHAIVILTPSSQYRVYAARMAQKDLVSGQIVSRQPYSVGVMFSSSNGTAWTAHQDIDLKFRLYGARFANEAVLAFGKVQVAQITHLLLATVQLVPRGCEIIWQWSRDGQSWYALNTNGVTGLGAPTDTVYVRAILRGSGGVSPIIQPAACTLVGMKYKNAGAYITRLISSQQPFTTVTVFADMHTPSGTGQVVEYSLDGINWTAFGTPVSSQQVDQDFVQYKYQATLGQAVSQVRIRIRQSSTVPGTTPRARRLMVLLS